jgi:hypothetical protein
MGSTWLFSERLFIRSFLANAGTHGLVNWLASPCINKQQEKQMKDELQKWMDKHVMVMTLSDNKKQEKKIKKAIETKVRESLTAENKNAKTI